MNDGLTAGQRVALAVEDGGTEADAERHGAPYPSVRRGRAVKKQRPDLFEKVLRGEMSDSTAAEIMARDKADGPASHPAAAIFPMMGDADRGALKADIAKGYDPRHPVLLHKDGRIIDGRNRVEVCDELGVAYTTETYDGPDEEIVAVVLRENLTRRHLNESQRAMVAARLAKLLPGQKKSPSSANLPSTASQSGAAEALNVSTRSVTNAAKVLAGGDKKLIEDVETGKKKVSQAARSLGTTKPGKGGGKKGGKASAPSPAPVPSGPRISSIAHPTLADTASQVTQFANRLAEISERVSAAELLAGFPTELREKIGLSVPQAAEFLAALWAAHVATTKNTADGPAASSRLN
jgi:hypothetical protein